MSPVSSLLTVWACMAVTMLLFYLIQQKTRNATVVDAVWAAGVGLSACFYGITGTGNVGRRTVLVVLGGLWGLRLAGHLILRSLAKPEDGRYAMLREQWGSSGPRYFFLFFQAQAFWVVLFSVPFLVVSRTGRTLWAWPDWAALLIWMTAVAGEACADWQLERFRRNSENRGRTCCQGLWRYSRHPNYFFEWLHWFTYVFLALGGKWWWISLWGPIVMLLFLYKVTGIPYTEKRALQSRGEDYRRYQQSTSAFIPWIPKRGDHETNH